MSEQKEKILIVGGHHDRLEIRVPFGISRVELPIRPSGVRWRTDSEPLDIPGIGVAVYVREQVRLDDGGEHVFFRPEGAGIQEWSAMVRSRYKAPR